MISSRSWPRSSRAPSSGGVSVALFGPPGRGDLIARRLFVPLILALALLLAVFWVAFTPVRIEGDSMLPVLRDGDRVLVTRGYTQPARGDVVRILDFSPRDKAGPRVIKRVVALPGDAVQVVSGRAFVNRAATDITENLIISESDVSVGEIVVPPGHVYVLGDNRPVSLDSRFFGPVPLDAVSGKVVFRYTPVTRVGMVD
jgi:signal peptidase I